MALRKTNLLVQMGQIPPTFRGTPAQFAAEMVRRMEIVSPSGTNFFFVGDVEPTSNVGPWLKNGNSWFVFDENLKRYVPLDISASETKWYFIGASTPVGVDPPIWLRTVKDATEADTSYGDAIEFLEWNGTAWLPLISDMRVGTTAERPANPQPFQKFYDQTITCLIWWERSAWRTFSGVAGDVKAVSFPTLDLALQFNPGWEIMGASNASIRGRYISQATKDSGAAAPGLSTSPSVAQRAAFETYGETTGVAVDALSPVPYPPTIALYHLVKT